MSVLNTINEENGVASLLADFQTNKTNVYTHTQPRLKARRTVKMDRKEKILEARRHNRELPIAKLPNEIRRQILKHTLPDRNLYKPQVGNSFMKAIRAANRRARLAKNHDGELRKRDEASDAAALVQAYTASADEDKCTAEGFMYRADAELFDCEANEVKSFATTLMLIDSNIIGNVASSIMYEEQVFQVHISENGIDFLDLPRIEHLQALQGEQADISMEGASIFGGDGAFRFGRMKHLEFFMYSETISRATGFRMSQNIECLVSKLLAEESGPNYISINFEPSISRGLANGSQAENDFWMKTSGEGLQPRGSGVHGLSNIEFVTLPFEKLGNLARVEINLPPALSEHAQLLEFKARVEALMQGIAQERDAFIAQEGTLAGAFEEGQYQERCKQMEAAQKTVEDKSWFLTDAELLYNSDDAVSDFDFDSQSDSEGTEAEE